MSEMIRNAVIGYVSTINAKQTLNRTLQALVFFLFELTYLLKPYGRVEPLHMALSAFTPKVLCVTVFLGSLSEYLTSLVFGCWSFMFNAWV